MNELSREQVEKILCRFGIDIRTEWRGDWKALGDTDAALRQALAQQAQRIQELEDRRIRYGPICLNCGKDKPCMTEAEANQHGASIPCIFDPAPKELWQRCEQQAQEVERVKEDRNAWETSADEAMQELTTTRQQLAAMTTERDEAQQRYERQCTDTKSRIEEIVHLRRDCEAWAHNYQLLQQQLATAQARVNELETKLSYAEQDW